MGKKKKDSVSPAIVQKTLVNILRGIPDAEMEKSAGAFRHKFLIMRANPMSGSIPIGIEDNTAHVLLPNYVAGVLCDYVSGFYGALAPYNVTFDLCHAAVKRWLSTYVDLIELPKPVAFLSDTEMAMARMPFDPKGIGDGALASKAPVFAGMLSRVTNKKAFCQRIGSIFDAKADRKQVIWMCGPTDCGKSQFAWLIGQIAGGSYGIIGTTDLAKPYWKALLLGKRVALVQEAAAKFIRSDEFKAITGDDEHTVEQKNMPVFQAKLPVLMFFFSNKEPEVPHDDALMERIIDCRVSAVPKDEIIPEADFRAMLTAEMPYITGYCLDQYLELKSGSRFLCDNDSLTETVDAFQAEYLDFLEHNFVKDGSGYIMRSRFNRLMVENGFVSPQDKRRCKNVFKVHFGAVERREQYDTNGGNVKKRLFAYHGYREREDREKQFYESTDDKPTKSGIAKVLAMQLFNSFE